MPSFSKLLILSTLLLSGVLSLPTALPDGVRSKREADPKADNSFHFGGDFDGGLIRGGSYKREAEAAPKPDNSFHYGGDFSDDLTRGGSYKRSASAEPEPEAHNTLDHVAISLETEKEKREAKAAPEADNSFHFGGDFDGELTRGGSYKREAEAAPKPDNSFHFGGDFEGGLTEDKRDSSDE